MADTKPYLVINLVLAGLIGLVFVYSLVFSAAKDNHPVPSFFEEITGRNSPSAGMSRAFSEIIRGNLRSAKEYNPDSPLIFAFFLIQGIQRITVSLILLKRGRTVRQVQGGSLMSGKRLSHRPGAIRYLPASDTALSLALFVYCFFGQIRAMVELFQQL